MGTMRVETIETINTLTDRLQTSTLLSDRRDACRSLRSLAKDYRVEVGAQAMEPMLQAIKNDGHDSEIVNYCLDSLNYIISGPLADSPAATWPERNEEVTTTTSRSSVPVTHDPGRELSEIFLKKADNMTIIVESSRDNNVKIRWVVVRILCGLVRQKLEIVQNYILSDPMKLTHLTQLISEEHELIRNDALVLFVNLTQSNIMIQNILAYDCFDKILYIIELEGYLDGTVAVVNDCLNIILNLIQYNESNQLLFRESGHIQKLMPFFNAIQTIQWTPERTACIVLVLQILDSMLTVIPTTSNTTTAIKMNSGNKPTAGTSTSTADDNVRRCQEIMLRYGLLDKLCELLTASSMPIGVMSETMNLASDMVRGHLGPNAGKVMQTSSMMPILLLSMVKEMCQEQEKRISVLYDYMQVLHEFVSRSTSNVAAASSDANFHNTNNDNEATTGVFVAAATPMANSNNLS